MQGCPANAEAALVVVIVVVHRAAGVGALRPGPEGLVVGTPDAGADSDAQAFSYYFSIYMLNTSTK